MSDFIKCKFVGCKKEFDLWLDNKPLCDKHFEQATRHLEPPLPKPPKQVIL